jgi:hypothetical protein
MAAGHSRDPPSIARVEPNLISLVVCLTLYLLLIRSVRMEMRKHWRVGTPRRARRLVALALTAMIVAALTAVAAPAGNQQTTPPEAQRGKGVVIRGCLTGSKLTRIDPQNLTPHDVSLLPDTLTVTSIRVIRSQVKALNGHEVEVTGALRAIKGLETGLLVVDSDNGKLYLGGADPKLGGDLAVSRSEPPTIHAQMIKNVAEACAGQQR